MTMADLGPATERLCVLIESVPDTALGRPTPCTEYTVGDLLHHITGDTVAWGGAAIKAHGESSTMGPWGDASQLDPEWRTSLPQRLEALAGAWRLRMALMAIRTKAIATRTVLAKFASDQVRT